MFTKRGSFGQGGQLISRQISFEWRPIYKHYYNARSMAGNLTEVNSPDWKCLLQPTGAAPESFPVHPDSPSSGSGFRSSSTQSLDHPTACGPLTLPKSAPSIFYCISSSKWPLHKSTCQNCKSAQVLQQYLVSELSKIATKVAIMYFK